MSISTSTLMPEVRQMIESGPMAHLSTVNADGSPHVTVVWLGIDGDDIVTGHMARHVKLDNMERDPRVVLTFEGPHDQGIVDHGVYLVPYVRLHAHASIEKTERASVVLNRLAKVYMAPDAAPAPPIPGYIVRYSIDRVGGVGPWGATAH
jgi:PPOX class probable F420-dependent enzyme